MGLGPYSGNYWDLTIADGTIVSATQGSNGPDLVSTQIGQPFRRWVTAHHPDDAAVMYDGSGWRISEESIPLWEQHTREYVEPRVGFVGLPPAGAQPSTPQRGREFSTSGLCDWGEISGSWTRMGLTHRLRRRSAGVEAGRRSCSGCEPVVDRLPRAAPHPRRRRADAVRTARQRGARHTR